jgi:hypothetical protein
VRTANRLLAVVFGLALAALGAITAIEAGLLAAGNDAWLIPREQWASDLRGLAWDDTGVRVTCILLAVVGGGLLLLQLVPRAPLRLHVKGTDDARRVSISRRGLEGQLTRLADRDPEVIAPTVRVGRRTARVRAAFPTHAEPGAVGQRLRTMAAERLDHAELDHPLKVKVRLRPAKRRVS